jgi:transketolase
VPDASRPTCVVAKTVMSRGVPFMENKAHYHGSPLNTADLRKALAGVRHRRSGRPTARPRARPRRFGRVSTRHGPFRRHRRRPRGHAHRADRLPLGVRRRARTFGAPQQCGGLAEALGRLERPRRLRLSRCRASGRFPRRRSSKAASKSTTTPSSRDARRAGRLLDLLLETFGVFGVCEAYNQQRLNDINMAGLKVVCTHLGLDVGEDGRPTRTSTTSVSRRHLRIRDHSLDPNQTDRIIRHAATTRCNTFVGMGRSKMPPRREARRISVLRRRVYLYTGEDWTSSAKAPT